MLFFTLNGRNFEFGLFNIQRSYFFISVDKTRFNYCTLNLVLLENKNHFVSTTMFITSKFSTFLLE